MTKIRDSHRFGLITVGVYEETLPNGVTYQVLDEQLRERAAAVRRYERIRGASGALFHDGRQPRQFFRQP